MATILSFVRENSMRLVALGLAVSMVLQGAGGGIAYASHTYTAPWTGYAWGNYYGASGHYIDFFDFANHPAGYCGDPAGNWAWGTEIDSVNPPDVSSPSFGSDVFYLYDNGDPGCYEPHYWADIYFGRYKLTNENCNCPGSPSNGYCVNTNWDDACQDAKNFGVETYTYTGP